MKWKKLLFCIVTAVAAAFIIIVVLWGKRYYEDRYVGRDYFTIVPHDFDATPETMYGMNGNEVGYGKTYKLTAYNERGESKEIEFNVYADRNNFPQPGDFLIVKASKQIVVGWNITDKNEIPESALTMINENN